MKWPRRILNHYRPETGRLSGALGLLTGGILFGLIKPWPFAVLVDSVLGDQPLTGIWQWLEGAGSGKAQIVVLCVLAMGIQLAQVGLGSWQNRLLVDIGLAGLHRIRGMLYVCLLQRPWGAKGEGDIGKGSFLFRATWDAYAYQSILNQGIFPFIQAILTMICMFFIMWRMHIGLTLVLMLMLPLIAIWMRFQTLAMTQKTKVANEKDSEVLASYESTLESLPLIQAFTGEAREQSRFNLLSSAARQNRLAQHKIEITYQLIISFAFALMSTIVTLWGALLVLEGQLPLGGLLVFLAYLAQLHEPLQQLSKVSSSFSENMAGIERVTEILDANEGLDAFVEPDAPRDFYEDKKRAMQSPLIEYEGVTFQYEEGHKVLENIDLRIEPGTWIGITGKSGQGKTTLLYSLLNMIQPTKGTIRFDNRDIRHWDRVDLRKRISLAPQPATLVSGSIEENMLYGCSETLNDDVWKGISVKLGLDTFIDQKESGYMTQMAPGKSTLSTGELQRVNLARACLKPASVFLFDEPASGLDEVHEKMFYDCLMDIAQGFTVVIVTHHPERVPGLDRLIQLENGKIIEIDR